MAKQGGHLVIFVEEANLTRDTEIFGTQDPYCLIFINGKKSSTEVKEDADKTPKWNYKMELDVDDIQTPILF